MRVRHFIFSCVVGISVSGCVSNPNMLGAAALGGAGGGYAGSMFGKGQGKLLSSVGGALLGAGAGGYSVLSDVSGFFLACFYMCPSCPGLVFWHPV